MKKQKQKQQKKEIKTIIWLTLLPALIGIYANHIQPTQATSANDIDRHAYLSTVQAETIRELTPKENQQNVADYIRLIAKRRNFKWPEYAVKIACCESLLGSDMINDKGNYPPTSIDRGFFGINSFWHSEITDECANNLNCSTNWFMDMVEKGQQHQWMCDKVIKNKPNYAQKHCGIN